MVKYCPLCEAPLISLMSLNMRMCSSCGTKFKWELKPGQKPLIKATR